MQSEMHSSGINSRRRPPSRGQSVRFAVVATTCRPQREQCRPLSWSSSLSEIHCIKFIDCHSPLPHKTLLSTLGCSFIFACSVRWSAFRCYTQFFDRIKRSPGPNDLNFRFGTSNEQVNHLAGYSAYWAQIHLEIHLKISTVNSKWTLEVSPIVAG